METGGYNPKFDFVTDLQYGLDGEENVIGFFESFNMGAVEVKSDRYRNGRMAVETHQRPNGGDWKPSGINVTEAQWWAYRFAPDSFVMVSVPRLKRFLTANKTVLQRRLFAPDSNNPAQGYLLFPQHVQDLLTSDRYD